MHERDHRDGHARASRRRRRVWLIAISFLVLAAAGWLLWMAIFPRDSRTADERLAEIEAARTIPDSDNAAAIYNELLQDPNATSVRDDFPEPPAGDVLERVRREPWLSKDLPQVAGWVANYRLIIAKLTEASRSDNCRFPISIEPTDTRPLDRAASMRDWAYLLSIAANNDVAEGRNEDALRKWRCLIQMDNHLRQQPNPIDHLPGMHGGMLALAGLAHFVVAGIPAETDLQKIEAMPLDVVDLALQRLQEAHEIERLTEQKLTENLGPLDHVKYLGLKHAMRVRMSGILAGASANEEAYYRRSTARARALRILVALRRYRNAAGRWPESLDEVKSSLAEEILTDPFGKGPFVYKRTSDAFRLYSKGQNNKDEDGRWNPDAGADDLAIWPPRGRSPDPKPADADGV